MALKSGEERLKEMEAEMALFEQEVLGGPVAPTVVEAVPVALAMPGVPIIRPIVGTNTYREIQQSLEARAATLVGPPPTFVGPAIPAVAPPPMMRPAFVPHVLQRPGNQIHSYIFFKTFDHLCINGYIIIYEELLALVAEQQAAGLLDSKKEAVTDDSVIGPSKPEPEPTHVEPADTSTEDKKKGKQEKVKKCIQVAAGVSWEDTSLLEWESDDFRIFCGDLGNEVNDDILARAFSRYPSFLKAKVVRDKRTGKTKGYGFVSFKDPNDYVRAMREMNGRYVGSRPIKLRKSSWKDRNLEVVRKKQKEKKKLGLR
ncbi:LOW QUALITY PROTEIN: RNA-binding protein 42 [Sinocyclocheilus grahami]|uniref:LOW QUALITY PROTEIN: RNA-binding protein 42 n=1 Tax=Sinocyclocheilus grahami TaxID=75366 RepID=UPI0007AC7196|nr:PREDICTED: LOW QUALITY PROTEIN: RNA-binding protein 42 [Sinocyclocheilus grahami]